MMSSCGEEESVYHESSEAIDAGKHGKDYELEIAKFVFKRLLDQNYESFAFTREKSGLGKFDDLALIYNDGKPKFSLFQLKHIINQSKKIGYEELVPTKDSYFSLPKYFNYYLDALSTLKEDFNGQNIKELVTTTSTAEANKLAELKELVICTNIDFEDNLGSIFKREIKNFELFEGVGQLYKLQVPHNAKKIIFEDSYRSDARRLADELIRYLMLQKYININTLKGDNHFSWIKTYHIPLAKYVIDINTHQKGFRESFFRNSEGEDPQLTDLRNCIVESFQEFYHKYNNQDSRTLMRLLKIKETVARSVQSSFEAYESSEEVEMILQRLSFNLSKTFGDEASDLESLSSFQFKGNMTETEVNESIDEFLDLLTFAVMQNSNTELLKTELETEVYIKFDEKMKEWYDKGAKQVGEIKKREWITKKRLLSKAKEYRVQFQGEKVKLGDLIHDDSQYSSLLLMCVFCSCDASIGQRIKGVSAALKTFYLPRTLKQSLISINALQSAGTYYNIFLISNVVTDDKYEKLKQGLPENQVIKMKIASIHDEVLEIETCERMEVSENNLKVCSGFRFFFIMNKIDGDFFEKFIDANSIEFEGKNIHWLKYHEEDCFIYKRSRGSTSDLKKYLNNSVYGVSEHDINFDDKFMIVCGEPGMGKSTLLLHLSEMFKDSQHTGANNYWVINIILKDYLNYLQNTNTLTNMNQVISFLLHFENGNRYSKELLKIYLMKEKRLILFFDGFDELFYSGEEDYQIKVLELLEFLKKTTICKIIVSSRFQFKETLEDKLGTFHFSFQELTEEEQVSFLTWYWAASSSRGKSNEKAINKEELWNSFRPQAEYMIEKFHRNMHNQGRSFLGIPLQTYMIAVAFEHEILEQNPDIPDFLHWSDLFEKFLKSKYEIYCNKTRESSPIKKLIKLLDCAHQDYAICCGGSLTPDESQKIPIRENSFDEDDLIDMGIVHKSQNGCQFVHKTFSEYLIAKRLAQLVYEKYQLYKEVLESILLRESNRFLLFLFDQKLTERDKFPLHNAVLRGEELRVLEFSSEDVNALDCMGRSHLYFSLQYDLSCLTNILIDKGISLLNVEAFLKHSFRRELDEYYKTDLRDFYTQTSRTKISDHAKLARFLLKLKDSADIHELIKLYKLPKEYNKIHKYLWATKKIKALNAFTSDIFFYKNHCNDCLNIAKQMLSTDAHDFNWHWRSVESSFESSIASYVEKHKDLQLFLSNKYFEDIQHFVALFLFNNVLINNIMRHYFQIDGLQHVHSLTTLIKFVKSRAQTLVKLLETLFLYKIQCPYYMSKFYYTASALPSSFYLKFDKFEDHETCSLEDIEEKISTSLDIGKEELNFARETVKELNHYTDIVHFEKETNIKDILCSIVDYELRRSEAWDLIDLFTNLHSSIKRNDVEKVTCVLEEASGKGWLRAVLNVCNTDFETALNIADKNGFQKVKSQIENVFKKP